MGLTFKITQIYLTPRPAIILFTIVLLSYSLSKILE